MWIIIIIAILILIISVIGKYVYNKEKENEDYNIDCRNIIQGIINKIILNDNLNTGDSVSEEYIQIVKKEQDKDKYQRKLLKDLYFNGIK